jgi:hypothetical protein
VQGALDGPPLLLDVPERDAAIVRAIALDAAQLLMDDTPARPRMLQCWRCGAWRKLTT